METQKVRDMFIDWMIIDIRNKMTTTPEIFIEETPFSYYNTPNIITLMSSYEIDFFSKDALKRLENLKTDMFEIYWENTLELFNDDAVKYADENCSDADSEEWYDFYNDYFDTFNISFDIFDTYIEKIYEDLVEDFDSYNLTIHKSPFKARFINNFDLNLNNNLSKMIVETRENKIIELFS